MARMGKSAIRGRRVAFALAFVQACCVVVPVVVIALWAFTSSWAWPSLVPQSFSARGVAELFSPSKGIGLVLARSIGISLAVAVITTAVAALAARALAFYRFPGKELFRFSAVLPFLIPSTVFAMGVQVFFIRAGLADTSAGVVVAHCIVALPYALAILGEVTMAAGSKLEQQARVCGAGPMRAFFEVQLPRIMPGLLSAASISYITSFSQYFLTLLIGGGAVDTFAIIMFPYLTSGDRTIASAYGLVFMAVTLGVFFVFEVLLKRLAKSDAEYFAE